MEEPTQDDILFTDYMKTWHEKKKNKIGITTWDGYYDIVVKHFISYFEPLKLNLRHIKAKHIIIDYYDFKFTNGKIRNKKGGLAHSSLRKHSMIKNNS